MPRARKRHDAPATGSQLRRWSREGGFYVAASDGAGRGAHFQFLAGLFSPLWPPASRVAASRSIRLLRVPAPPHQFFGGSFKSLFSALSDLVEVAIPQRPNFMPICKRRIEALCIIDATPPTVAKRFRSKRIWTLSPSTSTKLGLMREIDGGMSAPRKRHSIQGDSTVSLVFQFCMSCWHSSSTLPA